MSQSPYRDVNRSKIMVWISGIVAAGIFFLVVSLLYFFKAGLVVKLNEWGKKVLFSDEWTIGYRVSMGIFFLIVSIILFMVAMVKF